MISVQPITDGFVAVVDGNVLKGVDVEKVANVFYDEDAAEVDGEARDENATFAAAYPFEFFISADNPEGYNSLGELTLVAANVAPEITSISISRYNYDDEDALEVRRTEAQRYPGEEFTFEADVAFNLKILDLVGRAHLFATLAAADPNVVISRFDVPDEDEVELGFRFPSAFATLAECERTATTLGADLAEKVQQSPDPREAVSMTFSFPTPVRSACEQYLLHFGDFLRDLGVDASVRLQEFGEHVLFAVAPHDRRDALENIKTALETYLYLPNAEFVGTTVSSGDEIVAYKLRANLSHLQGQLELARAQNAALRDRVDAQQLAVELLRAGQSFAGNATFRASFTNDIEDVEPVTKYVGVAPLKHGPMRVDLPQLLRDIKALFRRPGGA